MPAIGQLRRRVDGDAHLIRTQVLGPDGTEEVTGPPFGPIPQDFKEQALAAGLTPRAWEGCFVGATPRRRRGSSQAWTDSVARKRTGMPIRYLSAPCSVPTWPPWHVSPTHRERVKGLLPPSSDHFRRASSGVLRLRHSDSACAESRSRGDRTDTVVFRLTGHGKYPAPATAPGPCAYREPLIWPSTRKSSKSTEPPGVLVAKLNRAKR